MKIDAVAVTSSDLHRTLAFYSCLGFDFPEIEEGQDHVEPHTSPGSVRLMIDTRELMQGIIGEAPRPGNHSSFAIRYERPLDIDAVCDQINAAGFELVNEPWDAFWGQRYAIVADPDGYRVDLFCPLEAE